eukprot:7928305-Pyramimonas_sp.AAC.1
MFRKRADCLNKPRCVTIMLNGFGDLGLEFLTAPLRLLTDFDMRARRRARVAFVSGFGDVPFKMNSS